LSKTTSIIDGTAYDRKNKTKLINGNQIDINDEKKTDYYVLQIHDNYSKNFEFDKADTTYVPGQVFSKPWRSTDGYFDIFLFFNRDSPQFINGKYADRIEEAFQLLVDYFPKVNSTEPERKSKF
jgi:hypothetical protein